MPIDTTVIILNFNGKMYLRTCIDAVLAQDYHGFEVILVDNASSDGSIAYVQKRYAHAIQKKLLRIIVNDQNYGFAEGNNIGYRAACKTSEFVVLLNNDTAVRKNWLRELVEPMRKYPAISIAGSSYYQKESYKLWVKEIFKNKRALIVNVSMEVLMIPERTIFSPHLVEAFYVSGNGMLLRRKDFEKPFDEDYFAYAEDVYAGWLAQIQGKCVVINRKAIMFHVGSGTKRVSSEAFRKKLLVDGTKNQMMNILLFYKWWTLLRILPLFTLNQLGHVIDNPRKIGIKLRALYWVLRHWLLIMKKRQSIQCLRKKSDKYILARMTGRYFDERSAQLLYNPLYRKVVTFANSCSLLYCRIMHLQVEEFVAKDSRDAIK